ncbi:hypothetical protein EDB83DRAFT_2327828, partial [Lactarius deliciosus]
GIDDKDDGSKDQDSDTDNTTASDTGNTDDDLTIRVNMQYMEFFLCKPEPGLPSQALSIVVIEDLKSSQNPTANRGKLRPTKFSYFSLAIATVCVTYEASQTRRHPSFTIPIMLLPPITTASCLVRARKGSRWPKMTIIQALALAPQTDNRSHDVSTLATVLSTPTIPIPNDRAITSSGTLLENVRLIHESNQCMSKGRLRLHYPRARCEPYSTPPVHSETLDAHSGNAGAGPIHLGRWPTPVALWAPTGNIPSNLGPSDQEPETIPTNTVNATTALGNARRESPVTGVHADLVHTYPVTFIYSLSSHLQHACEILQERLNLCILHVSWKREITRYMGVTITCKRKMLPVLLWRSIGIGVGWGRDPRTVFHSLESGSRDEADVLAVTTELAGVASDSAIDTSSSMEWLEADHAA